MNFKPIVQVKIPPIWQQQQQGGKGVVTSGDSVVSLLPLL